MKYKTNYYMLFTILSVCLFIGVQIQAMNFLLPYGVRWRPKFNTIINPNRPFQTSFIGEFGIGSAKTYNDTTSTDVLRIYSCDQNALTMLEGFPAASPQSRLLAQLDANDDGVRGHFDVCGDLKLDFAGAATFRYFFCDNWVISAYMPFYKMNLEDVVWRDKTLFNTDADIRVHELLIDNLFGNVRKLGDSLNLGCWDRTGPGDFVVMLKWFRDFPQNKEFLKNVNINWRVGVSAPSGSRRDEDLLFAVPFGTDGAFALPFGIGLELMFGQHFLCGMDLELIHQFGRTRTERIKTAIDQTELVLLQKAKVYRDFGLFQRFNLYLGIQDLPLGFSAEVGYQFTKRGDDDLSVCSNNFSNTIANTACQLKEWTAHQIIIRSDYDFGVHFDYESSAVPRLGLFARIPFNGKRSALFTTLGFSIACDF